MLYYRNSTGEFLKFQQFCVAKNYYYKQNMNLKYPFYGFFTWIYKIAISGYYVNWFNLSTSGENFPSYNSMKD